jgi:hypothetical protein
MVARSVDADNPALSGVPEKANDLFSPSDARGQWHMLAAVDPSTSSLLDASTPRQYKTS